MATRAQSFRRVRESELWGNLVTDIGSAPEGANWIHVFDRGGDNFEAMCRIRQAGCDWVNPEELPWNLSQAAHHGRPPSRPWYPQRQLLGRLFAGRRRVIIRSRILDQLDFTRTPCLLEPRLKGTVET